MEERGGCVRGVLKLLFTLIACLLLTSYMFPMNSPTDSTTLSGVVIKNETVEFVSMGLSGNGFFEVGDGGGSNVEEAGVEMGSYCESDESTEDQIVEYLEWNDNVESVDNSIEEANYGENDESVEAEIAEYSEWDEKEMFENENVDGEDAQFEGVRGARFEFRVDESEHLLDVKNDENAEGGIVLDMKVVSSYAGLDGDSLYKDEVTETENLVSPETVESEDDSSNLLEPIFEETPVESKDTDETGSVQELVGSQEELSGSMDEADDIIDDDDGDGDDDEVGMEK
ncbi:protein Ycf2-like [Salvia splendens]|uniref:protein Ycf2-like n=1 Tax=Salvia splendens TaxID=180675 RepID=UPI001C25D86C|nr:protein Ycf2-like [Salvia splendens]